MKERFKSLNKKGNIKINLGEKGIWQATKETILYYIKEVCEEYADMGYSLTLRQMYYQLVSKDVIPNHDKVYKKLSSLKDALLYSGIVDWDIFVDRGRIPHIAYTEEDIPNALERTISNYSLDKQIGQPNHIEVWTEKDAISDILKRVTRKYTVRLVVNKGYTSSTAIYESYCRFCESILSGQKVVILYFGDHDPSGLDMIRDIRERLLFNFTNGEKKNKFVSMANEFISSCNVADVIRNSTTEQQERWFDDSKPEVQRFNGFQFFFEQHFEVKPIGLTMEQIKQYTPPPNPAKITDPRADKYIEKFGQISWEVDALRPDVMTSIVEKNILSLMDSQIYNDVLVREANEIQELTTILNGL